MKRARATSNGTGVRSTGGAVAAVASGAASAGPWALAAGWRGVLLAWGEDGGDFGWVAQATRPRVSMQARVRRIIVAG